MTTKAEMKKAGIIHGGTIKTKNEDAVLKWTLGNVISPWTRERRGVVVQLYSFVGASLGAVHWYARIDEDVNPVWDDEEKRWCDPYITRDDNLRVKIAGAHYEVNHFCTPQDAADFILMILNRYFKDYAIKYDTHTAATHVRAAKKREARRKVGNS